MLSLRNLLALFASLTLLTTAAALGGQYLQSTHDENNTSFHSAGRHEQDAEVVHHDHPTLHDATPPCAHHHDAHQGEHHGAHVNMDCVALDDIHRYATVHFRDGKELPDTFHALHDWQRDWELRWVDYDVSSQVVRIYHAVHRHNPEHRFTSLLHYGDGRYHGWRPVE